MSTTASRIRRRLLIQQLRTITLVVWFVCMVTFLGGMCAAIYSINTIGSDNGSVYALLYLIQIFGVAHVPAFLAFGVLDCWGYR